MDCIRKNWRLLLLCALLAATTLGVFWPVVHHEFINYDDPAYITLNPHIATGLTWSNVVWAFTGYYTGNWHPLTWISHMVDVQLFGLSPAGPHGVNLLLHTVNAVLLVLLLHRLTGSVWRSTLVGALFALHPLHVESVAWAAERKDLLSTFFFVLTLMAYAGYAARREVRNTARMENGGGRIEKGKGSAQAERSTLDAQRSTLNVPGGAAAWYGLALVLFALGLMSKPMLVTVPCVLLLLDYWPLGRMGMANGQSPMADGKAPRADGQWQTGKLKPRIAKLLLEKLPFFGLSLGSCLVTMVVQDKGGAVASMEKLSLGSRLGNATVAYATYLKQLVWPVNLSVFYPLPVTQSQTEVWVCGTVLVAITAVAVLTTRRRPYGLVGWLWYLGMLVPVIGLVQVGMQSHADRYTYLPSIGIFILVAWGVGSLGSRVSSLGSQVSGLKSGGARAWVVGAAAVGTTAVLAVATHRQVGYWQNSRTLFQHATQLASDNYVAWQCLGIADLEREDASSALTNFYRGLECAKVYGTEDGNKYFIGAALQLQGKGIEAIPYLEQANVAPEQQAEKDYRLGISLTAANRLAEAETLLQRALAAKPQVPDFQLGLAALRQAQGLTNDAEAMFRQVAASFPTNAQAHKSLADCLLLNNRPAEAEPEYGAAVANKPKDARLRRAYATALTRSGKIPEAMAQLEAALQLEPTNAQAQFDFAELLSGVGRDREAVTHYDAALAAEPKYALALNNLAWLLATEPDAQLRNGPRAVELANSACQLTEWKQPFLIGTLAAAYAEAGRFPEAVSTAEKARDLARTNKLEEVAKRNEELLALYRAGKPYRDGK